MLNCFQVFTRLLVLCVWLEQRGVAQSLCGSCTGPEGTPSAGATLNCVVTESGFFEFQYSTVQGDQASPLFILTCPDTCVETLFTTMNVTAYAQFYPGLSSVTNGEVCSAKGCYTFFNGRDMSGHFPSVPCLREVIDATISTISIPDTTPEATSIPDTTPEATSIPDTTPEATSIPDTTPEATSILNTTPEATSIPDTTPEATYIPDTTSEATSIPPGSGTSPSVPASVLVAMVAPVAVGGIITCLLITVVVFTIHNKGKRRGLDFIDIPFDHDKFDEQFQPQFQLAAFRLRSNSDRSIVCALYQYPQADTGKAWPAQETAPSEEFDDSKTSQFSTLMFTEDTFSTCDTPLEHEPQNPAPNVASDFSFEVSKPLGDADFEPYTGQDPSSYYSNESTDMAPIKSGRREVVTPHSVTTLLNPLEDECNEYVAGSGNDRRDLSMADHCTLSPDDDDHMRNHLENWLHLDHFSGDEGDEYVVYGEENSAKMNNQSLAMRDIQFSPDTELDLDTTTQRIGGSNSLHFGHNSDYVHVNDHSTPHHQPSTLHDPPRDEPSSVQDQSFSLQYQPSSLYDQLSSLYDQPSSLHDQPYDQSSSLHDQPYFLHDQPSSLHDQSSSLHSQPSSPHDQPPSIFNQASSLYDQPSFQFPAVLIGDQSDAMHYIKSSVVHEKSESLLYKSALESGAIMLDDHQNVLPKNEFELPSPTSDDFHLRLPPTSIQANVSPGADYITRLDRPLHLDCSRLADEAISNGGSTDDYIETFDTNIVQPLHHPDARTDARRSTETKGEHFDNDDHFSNLNRSAVKDQALPSFSPSNCDFLDLCNVTALPKPPVIESNSSFSYGTASSGSGYVVSSGGPHFNESLHNPMSIDFQSFH